MRRLTGLALLLASTTAIAQNDGNSACLAGGSNNVVVGNDSIDGPFPLGITFNFFGTAYDHCFLSDHGLIYPCDSAGLPAPPCNGGCAHTYTMDPLSLTTGTPVIAPFWSDTNQQAGSATISIDANSPAIGMCEITWFDINSYTLGGTQTPFTFKCILDGTTGHITMIWGPNVTNDSPFALPSSQSAIMGVSPGGGIGLPPAVDLSTNPVTATDMTFELVGPSPNTFDMQNDTVLMIPASPGWVVIHTAKGAGCATSESYGAGCDGLSLDTTAPPIVNLNWDLTTTGFHATSAVGVTYFSLGTQVPPIPLPQLGFPATGCDDNIDLAGILFPLSGLPAGGSMTVSLSIPAALAGFALHAQSLGLTPNNPMGIAASNGETGCFGN